MKKYILFLPAFFLFSCGSSDKKETDQAKKDSTVSSAPIPETAAAKTNALPRDFYKRFTGTIGDNINISVDLMRISPEGKTDTTVTGSYYYHKIGRPLTLSGKINAEGEVKLVERNEKWDETGVFTGKLNADGTFSGSWTGLKNKKVLPFSLKEIKEGFAGITFKNYRKEDCSRVEKNKNKPEEQKDWTDEYCNYVQVDLAIITDCPGAGAINKRIEEAIAGDNKTIQGYLNSIDSLDYEAMQTITTSVSLVTNENDILCIYVGTEEFSGGAHPNHWGAAINFDITTGNEISPDQVFISGYEKKLNSVAEKLFIKANGAENWNFEPGKFAVSSSYSLSRGGITFHWDPYEIGPYMMGAPEVFIPFSSVKELLKPNGYAFKLWDPKTP
jgi:hypothetical protein